MKVVFTGHSACNYLTLQRLLLVADEIGFIDRPAVMFGNWGLIGHDADIRRFIRDGLPVVLSAHEPPSGATAALYNKFVEKDLATPSFIQTVAEGLARNEDFARKFFQFEANYGDGMKGSDILDALVNDVALANKTYCDPEKAGFMKGIKTSEGRDELFKMELIEASVQVTSAMFVAERTGLFPVTDDPYYSKLLTLRATDVGYIGRPGMIVAPLGLAIAKAVIPDAALEHIEIPALLEYRKATKDAYDAWAVELDRLAATIAETEPEKISNQIRTIIAKEVAPKVIQYRNEMVSVRDKLFGDLIKTIVKWEVPSLSLAYVGEFSLSVALAFFSAAAVPAVPSVVDYFQGRRELARKNSLSYLIGVTKVKK
jgi:hypothetical protein